MASNKSEESHLSSNENQEVANENTYSFMAAVKASALIETFPFNHVNTGYLKIISYWFCIYLTTFAINLPITFLFNDYNRINRISTSGEIIFTDVLFLFVFSALLLGKTRRNIKRPTYVQILTLIFTSLTYLPLTTFIYAFVRSQSLAIQRIYGVLITFIPFVYIVINLNAVWKFTHHKFFFVVFYIILYFFLGALYRIFFLIMHGSDSDIKDLFRFTSSGE